MIPFSLADIAQLTAGSLSSAATRHQNGLRVSPRTAVLSVNVRCLSPWPVNVLMLMILLRMWQRKVLPPSW